jgi:hypothetical protein
MVEEQITKTIITKLIKGFPEINGNKYKGSMIIKHIESLPELRNIINDINYDKEHGIFTNNSLHMIRVYYDHFMEGWDYIHEYNHEGVSNCIPYFKELLKSYYCVMDLLSPENLLVGEEPAKLYLDAVRQYPKYLQKFFTFNWDTQKKLYDSFKNMNNEFKNRGITSTGWTFINGISTNNALKQLMREKVNNTFKDNDWNITEFYNIIGVILNSVIRFIYGTNLDDLYGLLEVSTDGASYPDAGAASNIYHYNRLNIEDYLSDYKYSAGCFLVCNNLMKPIGFIEYEKDQLSLVEYRELGVSDVENYIDLTINNLNIPPRLTQLGNWLITPANQDGESMRYMITQSTKTNTNINLTLTHLHNILLNVAGNRHQIVTGHEHQPEYWLGEIINITGTTLPNTPIKDGGGYYYNLKRYLDYLNTIKYNYKIVFDYMKGDSLEVYSPDQSPYKLVNHIFTKSEVTDYKISNSDENHTVEYRNMDSNWTHAYNKNWVYDLEYDQFYDNYGHTPPTVPVAAGDGPWNWQTDHYDASQKPSGFNSKVYKRAGFLQNPYYLMDNLFFKPYSSVNNKIDPVNIGNRLGFCLFEYEDSSEPDLSNDEKRADYYNKKNPKDRRNDYDDAVDKFNGALYNFNKDTLEVTLNLGEYYRRFGRMDVNIGDIIIIEKEDNEYILGKVTKTEKHLDDINSTIISLNSYSRKYSMNNKFLDHDEQYYNVNQLIETFNQT